MDVVQYYESECIGIRDGLMWTRTASFSRINLYYLVAGVMWLCSAVQN